MTSLISGLWSIVGSNPDMVISELNKLFAYNKLVWSAYTDQLNDLYNCALIIQRKISYT